MEELRECPLCGADDISVNEQKVTSEWIKFTVEKDENGVEMYSSPIPDDEQEILVSDGEIIWLDIFINEGEGCYFDSGEEIVPNVTHWMPLPNPPKGDEK